MPLVVAPFWFRRAEVTAVLAWFAVNPIMTPESAAQDSFARRAMLGEELWLADLARDHSMRPLNAIGSVLLGATIVAAWRRRKVPTVAGTAASMALTLYGWRRHAAIYDSEQTCDAGT